MVKIKSFFDSPIWGKIFNRYNFTKGIIIFVVSLIIRIFIVDINVFFEFTNWISIVYYLFMAYFALVVHELVIYFDFCIIPKFVVDLFISLPRINFNCLKLSSIRNSVSYYFNRNKVHLTSCDSNINDSNSDNKSKESKVITFLMKNTIGGSNSVDGNQGNSFNNVNNTNMSNNNSNNLSSSNIDENSQDIGISSTSLELTPEKYDDKTILFSVERPSVNHSKKPVFNPYNEWTLRQTSSNSLLSSLPNTPKAPNPYKNLSTSDLDSNSVRFPTFSDAASNVTPTEIETPRNSINISQTNLSSTNTNYTNHGTYGSISSDFSTNYTNNTNHTTLGTNEFPCLVPTPDERSLEYRRQQIMGNCRRQIFENAMNNTVGDFTNVEVDVPKDGVRGKIKLGWKYLGSKVHNEFSKLDSMYIKYHDVSKRHFYWTIWEKKRGIYISYNEFKKDWDSNTSVWQAIKNKLKVDISGDVEKMVESKDPFNRRLNNKNIEKILYERKYRRK